MSQRGQGPLELGGGRRGVLAWRLESPAPDLALCRVPSPRAKASSPELGKWGMPHRGAPRWEQAENPQFEYPGREPGKGWWWEFLAIRCISSPPILTSLLSIGAHPWLGFWGVPLASPELELSAGRTQVFLTCWKWSLRRGAAPPFQHSLRPPHHQEEQPEASPLRTPTHGVALPISRRTGWV